MTDQEKRQKEIERLSSIEDTLHVMLYDIGLVGVAEDTVECFFDFLDFLLESGECSREDFAGVDLDEEWHFYVERVVELYQRGAELGLAFAQSGLGYIYEIGYGMDQDETKAAYWYKKAADQNDVNAQYALAEMYHYGRGLDQDKEKSFYWYEKAAKQNKKEAQYALAEMYYQGDGVEQNVEKAVEWYMKSAKDICGGSQYRWEYNKYYWGYEDNFVPGNASAQYKLAQLYEQGLGVKKSDEEAISWYKKAAVWGNAEAQYRIGQMYEQGLGVKQNVEEAISWYKKAVEQGNEAAEDALVNLSYEYEKIKVGEKEYAIQSRMTVFEKEMRELQMWMYGGLTHYIISYMYEYAHAFGDDSYDIPDMKYSEEKTVDFIHAIIDKKRYKKTHTSNVEEHADRLSFYKNILYCVLRTMTSGYTDDRMGNIIGYDEAENLTFSDVISCFEDLSGEILDDRMVYLMRTLYEIFSEKTIDLNVLHMEPEEMELTEEERKQMGEEAEAWAAREEELVKAQGINIDEFREEEQKEIQLSELEGIEKKDWLQKNFKKKEHFCRSLEEICAYLKEHRVNPVEIREDMKAMFFAFLTDRKLSVFENEEHFVEVMAQLKKTIRTAKDEREFFDFPLIPEGIDEELPFD